MFRKKTPSPTQPAEVAPPAPEQAPHSGILDQYVRTLPSEQNALDLFAGSWSSALPGVLGLAAGPLPIFDDDRIKKVLAHFDNNITGFKVLELGPLEGGHTYMLHEAGAEVTAIEGSSKAYLKCLVVKEILHMNRASFHLGDFTPYLEQSDDTFDLVLASGVLYHTLDPVGLLELVAKVTDKVAIWTHYWEEDAVRSDEKISRVFLDDPLDQQWRGRTIRLHPRHYREALGWSGFCGGPETSARWMERDGLMTVLTELGLQNITVLEEETDHLNGPAILLVAQR